MKNILTLFLLIFFVESCSTISKPLTEQQNLKGNVKSVTFKVFEAIEKDGILVKGKEHAGMFAGNNITTFDKRGYEKEYIIYSIDNKYVEYHKKYKYNRRGLLLEEKEFKSNGELKNASVYTYKGKKDSLRIKEENTIERIKNYVYKYDNRNNLIYYGGNTLIYDKKNNLIKEIGQYDTNNYEYDERGNMTKRQRISPYSITNIIFEYTNFDNEGNWIKQIEFREGKAKFISERKIEYY
jgi:hypothetical protein